MIKISINCFAASISFYLRVYIVQRLDHTMPNYTQWKLFPFSKWTAGSYLNSKWCFCTFSRFLDQFNSFGLDFTFFLLIFIPESGWTLISWADYKTVKNINKTATHIHVFVLILVTQCWECQFLENVNKHASVLLLLLRSCPTASKIRHFRITGWFCSTSNNSECDRRGQTAKFWKWVHQQNLFQATNICCGQEQLKNRKITAFPDSRQLLNTNKKRSASSCLLRPKDAKMPQAKLKTTAAAMTDCYKHWKKVKSQGFLLY